MTGIIYTSITQLNSFPFCLMQPYSHKPQRNLHKIHETF